VTSEGIGAAALRGAAERTAALLREVSDPSLPVPGLDWTAGEAAAHLVTELELWTGLVAGELTARDRIGEEAAAAPPSRQSEVVNARELADFPERDPARLADLLVPAAERFLAAAARRSSGAPVVGTNGVAMTAHTMTSTLLGEQLVHGLDIARAAKLPWHIAREDALLVLDGVMAMLPDYVDHHRAAGRSIRYELCFRGGPRYRLVIDNGTAAITEAGPEVDCRIIADPVAFMLVGYGRTGQWGQILRGRLLAVGRKPWLGLAFASLITRP
jgi:uncharacterized protein (TIGR03083 family)